MKQKNRKLIVYLLLCVFLCLAVTPASAECAYPEEVYVGGIPFGVRFFTDGILVVGYSDVKTEAGGRNPAKDAGILPGDCILKIDGNVPSNAGELATSIDQNGERALTVTVRRGEETIDVGLTPATCREDGKHRLGLLVRDSGAGIGTVTFVMEKSGAFGGLGHGICDGAGGRLIPLSRGSVLGVTIGGITKGEIGAPGELRGHFSAGKTGSLLTNTHCGVFGIFAEEPAGLGDKLPVGHRDDVHAGAATLRCTLDDNCPHEYSVEISAVNRESTGNKCFCVKVTDEALLSRTGGIVQGMSGSPIIQDGKLVGAVTHVLIGDPTAGYGIFIENMLNQMEDLAG